MTRGLRTSYILSLVLAVLVVGMGPVGVGRPVYSIAVSHVAQQAPEAAYDVIINEWSQGPTGSTSEWVELLVTNGPVDMRGWDLGDSSAGDLTFSNDLLWQSLPAGILIVVYNGSSRDPSLPTDDTDAGDCTLVIPHNNAMYFSGSWPGYSNSDSNDNPHLRDSADATVHNYSVDPDLPRPGSNSFAYYISNSASGVGVSANWTIGTPSTNATPGLGNGGGNTAWIASMGCGQAPPSVDSTAPTDGATGVSRLTNLTVDFSEPVNVEADWYYINCSLSGIHTAVESGGPQSFTLDPDVNLGIDDHCTVTIYADKVTDLALNQMVSDYVWSFDVGADAPPAVSDTIPPDGTTGVWTGADILVNFSENVDVAGAWYNILCGSSGTHSALVSGGPQSFTLNPDADFVPLENCTVTVYAAQVTDQDADDPPDNMAADHSWSFTVGTAAPPPCGGSYTSIFAIQGSAGTSSLAGSPVTTQGIVVGDFQNNAPGLGGFFLQDPWTDGNSATSDGIFVYNTTYDVNVGDHVRLTGTVQEYGTAPATLTEIGSVSSLTVCGTGYSLSPTPLTLPLPAGDSLYLEKYEGMLVTWPQELYVTENYALGRYGEVVLSSGGRLWQPTNVVSPGAAAVALQAENDRNRIILDDDNLTQNADPIDHPSPGLTAANTLRSGDTVTGLTGCLSQGTSGYSGTDNYRVHPTVPPLFIHAHPRPTAPDAPGGTVAVASFNVLNYFNGDGLGSGFPTSRGADTLEEFNRQRDKIIPAIVGLGADVIGLMEIENDSGALQAIQDLVNGLNAVEGAGPYSLVDTGVIGTDAIRVALIYRPARVTPIGAPMVDTNPINNRPTLAQTFEQNVTSERFSVVVNHFKSKGCDGATGLDADQGDGQGCYNDRRKQQATRLNDWINDTIIPTSGDPDVLIIGDLNSYALEDPITTLTGLGYTNLIYQFEGLDTYSYVYMGQSGYLDHALATPGIVPQVSGTSLWHINPDEPYVLDYNMEYKSTTQHVILYNADAYRSSDHDPVVIGLYPFDFGDLAGSYGTAWHGGNGTLRLGTGWTADPTFGPETDNATDDGLTMDPGTGWEEGKTVRIYAQVTGGGGYLAGWFDWNADGDFSGAQEKSAALAVSEGANTIDLTIPTGLGYTQGRDVMVRFRLYPDEPTTLGTETPTGGASGGETEDSLWRPPAPTAVDLTYFEATPEGGAVLLAWQTASELDMVGFHLHRATSAMGPYTWLNRSLIPARDPGAVTGAAYHWLDDTAQPGEIYYYKLEVIDMHGTSAFHGPVPAAALSIFYYLPLAGAP